MERDMEHLITQEDAMAFFKLRVSEAVALADALDVQVERAGLIDAQWRIKVLLKIAEEGKARTLRTLLSKIETLIR